MKERNRYKFTAPVYVQTGDKLVCTCEDKKTGRVERFEEKIGRTMVIDTVVTFDVGEPIFGLSEGIGAIFGKDIPE
jgi:hypothetical protein